MNFFLLGRKDDGNDKNGKICFTVLCSRTLVIAREVIKCGKRTGNIPRKKKRYDYF